MKDRKSRALSIRTIFSKPGNQTSVVSQKRVDAGGDIVGIQHQDGSDDAELIAQLKEENRRLNAEIEDLKTKNVLPGLIAARDFVEGLDGRTGKRQITEKLSAMIADVEDQ